MRWWRWVLLTLSAVATATAATLVAIAVNVATGGTAPWLPAVEQQPLWWSAGGTAAVAVAGVAGWWTRGAVDRPLPLVPAEQRPEPWIVGRPREVDQIVDALLHSGGRTVGVTTSLQGAGGFGKTTVAKLVRADRRILRRFGDRVHWVTVGRVPALVNDWLPPDLPDPRLRLSITGHSGLVRAVAIAPRSDWLATASSDRTVRLWNAATGAERMTLTGHADRVNAVAISPDGGWLASAGADRTIRLWDAVTGAAKGRLAGHRAEINALAIAPDGTWLSTVGDDGTVRIWDPATARQRAKLTGHSGRVTSVAAEPRGSWLATASEEDRSVRIWDPETGSERRRLLGHRDRVNAVAVSPDGKTAASGSWDGEVRLWNLADGKPISTILAAPGFKPAANAQASAK